MGLRFNRRIKLLPGLRLNIGKNGINGFTVGRRGLSITKGRRETRANIGTGVPGLSYSAQISKNPNPKPLRNHSAIGVIIFALVVAILVAILR